MTTKTSNRPTHHVYVVEGDGDQANWTRIGAAWPHKNGDGFTVQLASGIAVSGRFIIRAAKAEGGQS